MDLTAVKATTQINTNNYSSNSAVAVPQEFSIHKPMSINKSEAGKNQGDSEDQGKEELTREDINNLAEHLNRFMKTIDSDLQFEMHEDTKRLMVRFINKKNHQVIKEFPPGNYLIL